LSAASSVSPADGAVTVSDALVCWMNTCSTPARTRERDSRTAAVTSAVMSWHPRLGAWCRGLMSG
jgi:hypothetical protein